MPPLAGPQRARYGSFRESGEHGCGRRQRAATARRCAWPRAGPSEGHPAAISLLLLPLLQRLAPADVHGAGHETEMTCLEAVCVWSHQAECVANEATQRRAVPLPRLPPLQPPRMCQPQPLRDLRYGECVRPDAGARRDTRPLVGATEAAEAAIQSSVQYSTAVCRTRTVLNCINTAPGATVLYCTRTESNWPPQAPSEDFAARQRVSHIQCLRKGIECAKGAPVCEY